jgi:hypothetical protein
MKPYYILIEKEYYGIDDVVAWSKWWNNTDRHIAFDKIGDVEVSTIFLGIDHRHGGDIPVLFETLISNGPLDGDMDRYHTYEEAEEGHLRMVERVKRAL